MAAPRPARGRQRNATRADRSSRSRGSGTRPDRTDWPRRAGVAIALLALGGTIVVAGTTALPSGPRPSPTPSLPAVAGSPTPVLSPVAGLAPSIDGAERVMTRRSSWTVRVVFPDPLPDRRELTVRVYRDDELVAQKPVGRQPTTRLRGIALRRGDNRLTATLVGPGGETPHSSPVTVTRDDRAPDVAIDRPADGQVVNAPEVTVQGAAEIGAAVTVTNTTSDDSQAVIVGGDGAYAVRMPIRLGPNRIEVVAADEAGNTASDSILVTGGDGEATGQLALSQTTFRIAQLPSSLTVRIVIADADGVPVDGAPVVFSLSPPGQPTSTYRTTTQDGTASWTNVTLLPDGAVPGEGVVTAQVTLGDGSVVRELAPFRFR